MWATRSVACQKSFPAPRVTGSTEVCYAKLPLFRAVSCALAPANSARIGMRDGVRDRRERRREKHEDGSEVTERGGVSYVSARLFDHGIPSGWLRRRDRHDGGATSCQRIGINTSAFLSRLVAKCIREAHVKTRYIFCLCKSPHIYPWIRMHFN